MKVSYKRKYFYGGKTKSYDSYAEDYITGYEASNGKFINIIYTSNTIKQYEIEGKIFPTLSDAKTYCETQ